MKTCTVFLIAAVLSQGYGTPMKGSRRALQLLLDAMRELSAGPPIDGSGSGMPPVGSGSGSGMPPVGSGSGSGMPPVGSGSGSGMPPVGSGSGSGMPPVGSGSGSGMPPVGSGSGSGMPPVGSGSGSGMPPVGSGSGSGMPPVGSGTGSGIPPVGSGPGSGMTPFGSGSGSGMPPFGSGSGSGMPPFGSGSASGSGSRMPPFGSGSASGSGSRIPPFGSGSASGSGSRMPPFGSGSASGSGSRMPPFGSYGGNGMPPVSSDFANGIPPHDDSGIRYASRGSDGDNHVDPYAYTGKEYEWWHEAWMTPNCDFLINLVDRYLDQPMPANVTITDHMELDIQVLTDKLPQFYTIVQAIQDPETLAYAFTKEITAIVLERRMQCPATLFDFINVQVMMKELELMFDKDDESLVKYLLMVLQKLPTTMTEPDVPAAQMATHIHERVFEDTIHYLIGTGLHDVAVFSRRLFDSLKSLFTMMPHLVPSDYDIASRFVDVVYDNLYLSEVPVMCPIQEDHMHKYTAALGEFIHGLKSVEESEVCMEVRDYVENYSPTDTPVAVDWSMYQSEVDMLCGVVMHYISEVLEAIERFEEVVISRDSHSLVELFERQLSGPQLKLLAKVLEHLNWQPNVPVPNPEPPVTEFTIPAQDVLRNEKADAEYLKGLLTTITDETFSNMTAADFRGMIQAWLADKLARIDDYTNYVQVHV